jgi:uncharacterized protein (TIGR00251 family)
MVSPDITFSVKVIPSANRDEVLLSDGDEVVVRVKEPPVRGKANRAVIKALAAKLGVARSAVRIEAGATGRRKRVRVEKGREAFERIFGAVPPDR